MVKKIVPINGFFVILLMFFCNVSYKKLSAQSVSKKAEWQHLDLELDGIFGISSNKAYEKLLHGKVPTTVVVAVIDGGIDISHDDLKSVIWTNDKEIPGNGIDDDHNGYIDDIHGWNFMGSSKGSFQLDNADLVRSLRKELGNNGNPNKAKKLARDLLSIRTPLVATFSKLKQNRIHISSIIKKIGSDDPSLETLRTFKYTTEGELTALTLVVKTMNAKRQTFKDFFEEFEHRYNTFQNQLDFVYNIGYNPREGNKEYDLKFHGNNNVKGLDPSHGTHAAGIIGAVRNNGIGINGIADCVKIMVLRAVPEGDMLDEDLAYAIRYAVDNGAKIINLSVIKFNSPNKLLVDQAVKYAMSRGVLIVHAAGNQGRKENSEQGYPNRHYLDGGIADHWIQVGASDSINNYNIMARFSNYGKNSVDVFAPGVNILSTYPENRYKFESGTSMAAPVVSGLAALVLSYYPILTVDELKRIIIGSVVKYKDMIKNGQGEDVKSFETSLSGGVVNAYSAIELIENLRKK